MKKSNLKFIFLWAFLIVSFAILAIILILEANGYRLNRETWTLEQTGTIVLDGQPRQVSINVNGKILPDSNLPKYLFKILPGQYDIVISQDGYQAWSKTLSLKAGQAIENAHILLFFTEPRTIEATDKTLDQIQNDFKNQSAAIAIKENEIWFQDDLITRFADKPAGAVLTPDRSHIIFQLNNEIRVIDIDGTNNCKLISLPDPTAVVFALYNDKLYFAAGGKIFEAEIR